MKSMVVFGAFLFLGTSLGFAGEANPAHVSRVIEMCHGKLKEINISELEQAAQVLEFSHPDLAAELQKMAKESVA